MSRCFLAHFEVRARARADDIKKDNRECSLNWLATIELFSGIRGCCAWSETLELQRANYSSRILLEYFKHQRLRFTHIFPLNQQLPLSSYKVISILIYCHNSWSQSVRLNLKPRECFTFKLDWTRNDCWHNVYHSHEILKYNTTAAKNKSQHSSLSHPPWTF